MSFKRIAAIAGIVFVVMIVANQLLLGNAPLPTDSAAEIGEYLSEDTKLHKTGSLIGHLVLLPAVVFFAGVLVPYRKTDQEHGEEWSTVILLSAIALAASAGIGDSVLGALLLRGGEGIDAAVARGLWDVQTIAYTATLVGVAGVTLGVAIPSWTHKIGKPWYLWLSVVVAILAVLATLATISVDLWIFGLLGFAAFLVWALVTAILMYKEA